MNQIEENVMNSFRLAKRDIIFLQKECIALNESQKRIIEMFKDLAARQERLNEKCNSASLRPITKIVRQKPVVRVVKKAKIVFIASKEGKKFHDKHCPFAHNIMPMRRIVFKTKDSALNKGYTACNCVK